MVFFTGPAKSFIKYWLVVWNIFVFFHMLGMASSQLTFIFLRGAGQPPTRICFWALFFIEFCDEFQPFLNSSKPVMLGKYMACCMMYRGNLATAIDGRMMAMMALSSHTPLLKKNEFRFFWNRSQVVNYHSYQHSYGFMVWGFV